MPIPNAATMLQGSLSQWTKNHFANRTLELLNRMYKQDPIFKKDMDTAIKSRLDRCNEGKPYPAFEKKHG